LGKLLLSVYKSRFANDIIEYKAYIDRRYLLILILAGLTLPSTDIKICICLKIIS